MFPCAFFKVLPQHETLRGIALMRAVAVLCLTSILVFATQRLKIDLPLWPLATVLAFLVAFNAWTWLRMQRSPLATDPEVLMQLLVDVSALSIMLYFSGGATNPFASFFLPDIAVAAALLSWRYALLLASFAIIAYSLLFTFFIPLHLGDPDRAISYHLGGMWANFAVSAALITWFVAGLSRTVRQRDAQLAQAQLRYLQNDRLVALGIQAANAAHEIGTPLSTVAIIADELLYEIDHADTQSNHQGKSFGSYRQEISTIEAQITLCKAALERMGKYGSNMQSTVTIVSASAWLAQFIDQWRLRYPEICVETDFDVNSIRINGSVFLEQILTTLLDNAAQAMTAMAVSNDAIHVTLAIAKKQAVISIIDKGPGIAAELLMRLGYEPITKPANGNGIGLFLAFATARQIGIDIELTANPGGGTCARLTLPLV